VACPYFDDVNGPHGSTMGYVSVKASPRQMSLAGALIGRFVFPDEDTPPPVPLSRRQRARLRAL
jgi:hypothetical protein